MAAFSLAKCAKFLLKIGTAKRGLCVTSALNQITSNERSFKTSHRSSKAARGNSPSYCKMLQERREEAERSIIVNFPAKAKVQDIMRDAEEIGGPIKNALFYKVKNQGNYILFEFEDPTAFSRFHHDRMDFFRVLQYHPQDGKTPFLGGPLPSKVKRDELMYEEFDVNDLDKADTLSDQISTLHFHLKMRHTQTRLKFFICQQVEEMVRWIYPGAIVLPFGSGATGLGLVDGSDLDMYLVIDKEKQDSLSPSFSCIGNPPMARLQLQKAGRALELSPQFRKHNYILRARVPIVTFIHDCTGFECDLSCSTRSGLAMSQIQYLLSQYDERFHPLITVLRVWSRAFQVRMSGPGPWLSNFMLQMLIVHFLQTRNHPVLPPIKDLYRDDVGYDDIDRLSISLEEPFLKDISELPASANKESTGDLLTQFFQYYADFPFKGNKIDLHDGTYTAKPAKSCIWVENPCEKGHNICENVNRPNLSRFMTECQLAVKRLEDNAAKASNSPWGLSYVINPELTKSDSNNKDKSSTNKLNEKREGGDKTSRRNNRSGERTGIAGARRS